MRKLDITIFVVLFNVYAIEKSQPVQPDGRITANWIGKLQRAERHGMVSE